MTKWRSLIIFAAVVIVAALGGWAGSRVAKRLGANLTPTHESPTITGVPKAIEETPQTSKVVLDETETPSGETFKTVSGKISSISGQNLILEAEGDRLEILVAADAKITQTTLPHTPDSEPQVVEIALNQLQVGQKVDALLKIEGRQATATNLNIVIGP